MKVLFVGPTLYGEIAGDRLDRAPELRCRGPARQGDIARAVLDGATAIGLVDGRYEDVAAPWRSANRISLCHGVAVLGGGSIGALRAVECAPFGMIGIGAIFEAYASGARVDDSDVAQLHAPAELDYAPLTEALVNVEATFRRLVAAGRLEARAGEALCAVARGVFFKSLTFEAVAERAGGGQAETARLLALVAESRVDVKREDAQLLVARMRALPAARSAAAPAWAMAEPPVWRRFLRNLRAADVAQ
jgi:hypothetical protein